MASFGRVAIVGVGLLGGSVGLGLKHRRLADRIVGVGRRAASLDAALKAGAVDSVTLDLAEGVRNADLVVFATPVTRIRELIEQAAPSLGSGQLVTDVGSTKQSIVEVAERTLAGAQFVGSHPMAGAETSGVAFARPNLFDGALCFVTRTAHTPAPALERIAELWRALGARVRQATPIEHDRIVAAISHAPHVVAAALVNALDESTLSAAGPGFIDLTRIASSDPDLWTEICSENRTQIADALSSTAGHLNRLAAALRGGDAAALREHFLQAKKKRDSIKPCAGN